jgi:hypothetical protein
VSPPPPPPKAATLNDDESGDDTVRPGQVTLRMRAVPLIETIQIAIARGSDLMWERG